MHLADAFIQSDLQCIQAIHLFYCFVSMCSLGIEPTNSALLKQCSTTEPTGTRIALLTFGKGHRDNG